VNTQDTFGGRKGLLFEDTLAHLFKRLRGEVQALGKQMDTRLGLLAQAGQDSSAIEVFLPAFLQALELFVRMAKKRGRQLNELQEKLPAGFRIRPTTCFGSEKKTVSFPEIFASSRASQDRP
jgi:hypothetical protein